MLLYSTQTCIIVKNRLSGQNIYLVFGLMMMPDSDV